jgi:integrase
MGKLTDIQIRGLLRAGDSTAKSDGDGLTLTISNKGTASWILRYRFGGKGRELTIGRYPDIPLSQARMLAADARARIQKGEDVARDKQKALIERVAAKSLRELGNDYMEKVFPRLAENTQKQRRRHIERIIFPKLGSLAAKEVSTADVVALIEAVGKNSINVAELVLTAASEIFKHGIGRHVVTHNPCAGISITAICGKPEPKRQRLKLTEDELRAILPALPSIGEQNALAAKIQLATCIRLGELAQAEWQHVDLEGTAKWQQPDGEQIDGNGPKWLIPLTNQKTAKTSKRHFVVPLTPAVVEWFKELHTLACGSRYVLPARQIRRENNHGGEVHFEQRALNSMLHKLCDKLGNKTRRFTPHDLRSTARSHMAAMGVNIIVAERCLNHTLGGLVSVYDQHDYIIERRSALENWTSFIVACESGVPWISHQDNVIPMRRKTG